MASFISQLTEKAQELAQKSPLAGKIPGTTAPDASGTSTSTAQGGSGGMRGNHTLGAIQHQLRQFGQQYSSASPVQRIITTSKGVSIDFDSVARDAHAQSKEMYMWGQNENDDIKDVTDRLAFINYVHGSLAGSLANKLNDSRESIKALRNAENALAPKRQVRAGLQTQIGRIEHGQEKSNESRLVQLREQLALLEREDADSEKEVEVLKRKAIRESENAKWAALREYGEKLVLLSQAANLVSGALPTIPPSTSSPYTGAQKTAGARASLQRALDNYRTGHLHLPPHEDTLDSAASVASFGETHSSELARIDTGDVSSATIPNIPMTPPPQSEVPPGTFMPPAGPPPPPSHPEAVAARDASAGGATSQPIAMPIPSPSVASPTNNVTSPGLDPSKLNQAPAALPTSPGGSTTAQSAVHPASQPEDSPVTGMTPTVAETGVPVSAGEKGPGPASGSLADLRRERFGGDSTHPEESAAPVAYGAKHETAEEEKKRLEREERERVLAGHSSQQAAPGAPAYESADDEKKRLEREERERVLAAGGSQQLGGGPGSMRRGEDPGKGEELPPYQEPF